MERVEIDSFIWGRPQGQPVKSLVSVKMVVITLMEVVSKHSVGLISVEMCKWVFSVGPQVRLMLIVNLSSTVPIKLVLRSRVQVLRRFPLQGVI